MRIRLSAMIAAAFLLGAAALPALADSPEQPRRQPTAFQTSTPLGDGRILYTVQAGDTLWKISAITGVPIDELERLNNINRDDPLVAGTVLILRIVVPTYAEPTLAFQPSPTPSLLPVTGKGTICVSFFDDLNGDGSQNVDTESLVAGGQVSVALSDGTEMGNHTITDTAEEYCFVDVPAGSYSIAAAAPKNFNPTADMNKSLLLEPGATAKVSFAVQKSAAAGGGGSSNGGNNGGGSLWLGLIGLVILGGAGFMVYSMMRPRRRSSRW
jgi:murein DD-endopeptidase MepM/ murein hydrolase activator NlpD